MASLHLGIDFSNTTAVIGFLAALPIVVYLIGSFILNLLTPKPLPGIPYRKGRQYPIIGDGLDAGKWLAAQTTITQWFDGCTKAFIYGGTEIGSEWGVLNGKRSADELLEDLEKPGMKRSDEYEGISQLMFGFGNGARQVIVTDVEEIHQVLTKRTAEFDRADVTINVFRGILPLGQISLKTDSMWKHHRRALGPTMTSKNLKMFHPRAIEAANNLIKLWHMKAEALQGHEFFESSDDLMYFAMDAITDIAFGKSFDLLSEYIRDFRKSAPPSTAPAQEADFPFQPNEMFRATEYLLNTLPLFSAFPRVSTFVQEFKPTFRKNRTLVHNFIYEQIRQGRARMAQRGDDKAELADCAIDMALLKDGTADELADAPLRDEVFQYAVAGMETSARTLAWGMKRLSRSPSVQEKLRKELMDAGLQEREMTFDDIAADRVPYLEATTHEILRLAGTAAGVSRIATKDTVVLGKSIPKGTTLYLPLALIAAMPLEDIAAVPVSETDIHQQWKGNTLMEFKPERWLDDEGKFDSHVGLQSAPFSAGQRGCFGKSLAMLELKTMLAKINLAFFLDTIPAEYDSDVYLEYISRKPKAAFIRPIPWKAHPAADASSQ